MKLKLDNKQVATDFYESTCLFGMVAPIKNYHFCWRLNNHLRFDFRINNDIEIQLTRKDRQYFFSVYSFDDPLFNMVHYLYHNSFDGEYLLPEFRHLDFIWLMKGEEILPDYVEKIMNLLKGMPDVQLVIPLPQELLKNREHLIF